MRIVLLSAVGCCALLGVAAAEEPRRQLGPHEHGHAYLNIAIDGNQVVMELDVPGVDIIGSEVKAETPEAKAAEARGIAALEKTTELFRLSDAAACKVVMAKAMVEVDNAEATAATPAAGGGKPAPAAEAKTGHSDFQARYDLTCASPEKITALQLDYFQAFPNAQKVTVQVASAKGQGQFETSRANPRVDLSGLK